MNKEDIINYCLSLKNTYQDMPFPKDFNESIELHKEITNYGVNAELISENLDKYTGGVIVIPSYLSKGLEFDSVIISDSNKYSEDILETKLLYVACTRAMHTLDIISK